MKIEQLARIDLNLLVILKVLLDQQSVTKASETLYVSQSAVSKSLAKLRLLFEDPLFYRHSHGLQPTPKCRELAPKLDTLLRHLESITAEETFNPATTHHTYQIATVESAYPLIFPHVFPKVLNSAPNIKINTHSWDENSFTKLLSGELDFGITGKDINDVNANRNATAPFGINELEIYRDQQMCIVRQGHPVLDSKWDLETFLQLRHVQVRCDGNDQWLLDHHLQDIGRSRNIALTVPDFNNAASLCSYTDLVFTAPSRFIELVAARDSLHILPLPLEFPSMAYTLFWNESRESNPTLRWLRKIIEENAQFLR